eukprot:TRINITY_DN4425_c0_g1_i2.p1 TRINITY_DN4425_c0_g1~~TRINITY_DN4425_c0_g1_i2.p1  ORF type:complete len:129 (+),score=32.15 TRINITY_DN4425_c0_g1_i2:59-445(+)
MASLPSKVLQNRGVQDAVTRFETLYEKNEHLLITKDAYFKVNRRLISLLDKSLTVAEVGELLQEDWKSDSKGKETITPAQLRDGIFELASEWSPTIHPHDIVALLDSLNHKIIHDGQASPHTYDPLEL